MSLYESVALHSNPEYKQACVEVLSEEWPRSASSRSHTLLIFFDVGLNQLIIAFIQ